MIHEYHIPKFTGIRKDGKLYVENSNCYRGFRTKEKYPKIIGGFLVCGELRRYAFEGTADEAIKQGFKPVFQ